MPIGERLRELRLLKNLTQEELGERSDLTKGYISQLENNQTSPTLDTLQDVLTVLGCSLADFFATTPKTAQILFTQDDQVIHEDEHEQYRLTWLVSESNEYDMEPVLLELSPKGQFKAFNPSASETFIYVLSGSVSLQLGECLIHAKAHETLYFTADAPHQLFNHGHTPALVILVATESYL